MPPEPDPATGNERLFDALFSTVTVESGGRFGHRQHVQLTWMAVRRYGSQAAAALVSNGIRRTAAYAGRPQKYHHTVSYAWAELVAHHVEHDPTADFEEFAARNPELLDKRLLARFYEPATLAGASARSSWVGPDREPFPWTAAARE